MTIATVTPLNDEKYSIAINSPFSYNFKEELKDAIDWREREFGGKGIGWKITAEAEAAALEIAAKYFDVMDTRKVSSDDVEDAKLDAELVKIKAALQVVRDNEVVIEREIAELDDFVASFSFKSKSGRKASAARRVYRLRASLQNAKKSAEELVQVEVAGILATAKEFGD